MKQGPSIYNLYCVNTGCEKSIYSNAIQTQAIFDIDNLTAAHICTGCRHKLISAIDMEIGRMLSSSGIRMPDWSFSKHPNN